MSNDGKYKSNVANVCYYWVLLRPEMRITWTGTGAIHCVHCVEGGLLLIMSEKEVNRAGKVNLLIKSGKVFRSENVRQESNWVSELSKVIRNPTQKLWEFSYDYGNF